MKRWFLFLIVLVLILSSCDVSETTSNVNNDMSKTNEENVSSEVSKESDLTISFSEQIVIDDEKCTIKITKIEDDSIWGYTLKVFLENKSADKKYMFSVDHASINGLEIEPLFATEVESGKKANESLVLSLSELEEKEIGLITDIDLKFRVYDSDDWMAEDIALVSASVYPYGESKVEKYIREDKSTDTVIVNNDNIKVVVTDYTKDEIWGYTANLYIENKTDKELMFSANDVSINGFMVDPLFATSVVAGKCEYASMTWFNNSLEENEIEEVSEIEFNFRVYDSNNWELNDLFAEKITLNP